MRLLMVLVGIAILAAGADPDVAAITGTWRGQSVCVTEAAACRNENVVYYIKEVSGRTDVVLIQADRVVDGKTITMGSGEWQYHGGAAYVGVEYAATGMAAQNCRNPHRRNADPRG